MQVLKFKPIYQYRIWAGNLMKAKLKRQFTQASVGESWEISTVSNNESIVINGTFQGKRLTELIEKYPNEILGKEVIKNFGKDFPLLIKFIDAGKPLSVQVHPNDELAKIRHNSLGKTEMWVVLDAKPGSEIIMGFKEGVTSKEYLEHLENETIEKILNFVPAEKGTAYFIPAGLVHAIGAGVLLAEIQQTSDVTYRIYDYNRKDKDGKRRELHTELAMDAIDFQMKPTLVKPTKESQQTLVDCPFFKTQLFKNHKTFEIQKPDYFSILIGLEGGATIHYANETIQFSKGESILVPADIHQIKIIPNEEGISFLETYV